MQPKTLGNVLTPEYCSDALLGAKGKTTFFWVWVGFPLQGMVVPLISHPGIQNRDLGASLVAQWLRIRLPMQGTRVQALVWEDPTCRGATKPMRHNY